MKIILVILNQTKQNKNVNCLYQSKWKENIRHITNRLKNYLCLSNSKKFQSKILEILKTVTVEAFVITYMLAIVNWNTQEECCAIFVKNCASCVLCWAKDNC